MSIQSEIERISGNVASAYTALSAKGATMPDTQNTENLTSTIESLEMVSAEAMSIETIWEICGYVDTGLPSGYTLLNYIQCSGTQYIDTGFKPNQDTTLEMKCQASGSSAIAAVDTSWTKVGFGFLPSYGYYGNSLVSATFTSTSPIIIKQDKNKFYKDGTLVATATSSTFQCAYNLALFGLIRAGTINEKTTSCILYYCQIYDNGTLVRDYVPCINASGEYGLYDKVNEQFYGNAGSGSFTGA